MTGQLKVDTPHLRGMGELVQRNGAHCARIGDYISSTAGSTDGWNGLLSLLRDNYAGMAADGQTSCLELYKGLNDAGAALGHTAHDYDTTDNDVAVQLSTVGAPVMGPYVPASGPGGTASYADVSDPLSRLTAPQSYDDLIASQVDEIGGIIGLFNDVYEWVTGESLLAKIVEPVSGDWGKVYGNADAWDNVGTAYGAVIANLADGLGKVLTHWEGQAASAFDSFMNSYVLYLQDAEGSTATASNALRDLAEDTKENFDVIIQTLNTVWSLISAALASFAIPIYGQGKLIKAVWDTAKLIWNIYKIINAIRQLIDFVIQMTQLVSEIFNDTGALPQAGGN